MSFDRDKLSRIVSKYITDEAAAVAAVELVSAVKTVEGVMGTPELTPDLKVDILRILTTVFLELPANPFWQERGGYVSPVVATVVNTWLDAPIYASQIGNEPTPDTLKAVSRFEMTRNAVIEIIMAVYYAAHGAASLRNNSLKLRNELMEFLG